MNVEILSQLSDQSKLYLVHLIDCALKSTVPEKKPFDLTWEQIYKVCRFHSITSTVYPVVEALLNQSDEDTESVKNLIIKWKEDYHKAIVKELIFDNARADILLKLEEAQIRYLPLKGVILKNYYPAVGMRMFADNDILYDSNRMYDVKNIMNHMGYQTESIEKSNHDVYKKPPVLNFEMHRSLVSFDSSYYEYYCQVWEKAEKNDRSNYGYHMSREDFYIYFIVHAYKHYSQSGTGLRTVLDQYLFLKKEEKKMDWEYVSGELIKLKLVEFEMNLKELGAALFSKEAFSDIILSESLWETYQYIFNMGTYGTLSNGYKNQFFNSREAGDDLLKSKTRYFLKRLFPTREWVRINFPITARYPILYPCIIVYRFFRVLKKWRQIKMEANIVCKLDEC